MAKGTYFRVTWEDYCEKHKHSFRSEIDARKLYQGIVKNSDTLKAKLELCCDNVTIRPLDKYKKDRPSDKRLSVRPIAVPLYDPLANWS